MLIAGLMTVGGRRTPGPGHLAVGVAPPTISSTTTSVVVSRPPLVRQQLSPTCHFSLTPGVPTLPVGDCTVLEIGDSLGNDLGWGLAREVPAASGLHLVQLDRSATGLVDTAFYDWATQLATDLRTYHPQLVLVSLGGNDEQGIELDGSAVQFPSPAWKAAYLSRVGDLIREATAAGADVVWVGLPIMQQPEYSEGIATLDALYQESVRSDPDAVFVPTWSLFSGPAGRYDSDAVVDGRPAGLREPDGIHYSLVGENVLATYVLEQVAALGHIAVSPSDPATITAWN